MGRSPKQECHRNPKPGWGHNQAPDLVTPTSDGRLAIWFRPKAAPKPEEYDFSVPHRGSTSWRVYFLALCTVMVPLCCIARLVTALVEGVAP